MDDCPLDVRNPKRCKGKCRGGHSLKDVIGDAPIIVIRDDDPRLACACGITDIEEGPLRWDAIETPDGVRHTRDRCYILDEKSKN